jgi:hypothetical protein
MSVYQPDKKDVKFEAELQAHPFYYEHWQPVRVWLSRFRSASTPRDYYDLHHELINRFYGLQQLEDGCREREKALGTHIRAAKAGGAGAESLKPLSQELAGVKVLHRVAGSVRAVYRDLADALVWKLFGYRRPMIAAIGKGEVVGRLSDEGLQTEVDEIQWLWEQRGIVAVHADITSCVRHGDVLAFESLDPLRIYVTESKKSGKFDPNSAQAQRLRRLQELIERGAQHEAADGQALYFARPGVAYATYHGDLRDLLAAARSSTYAWKEIDGGLALEVWDEANPAGASNAENESRHANLCARLGWTEDLDVITTSAALRRLRSRQLDHNFASLAPLSLTPLGLDDTTDLIFGRIDFITTLHVPTLEVRLAEAEISAQVARGNAASNGFLRAERGHAAATIPAHVREQVQIELMRLDTLGATITWFLDDVDSRHEPLPNVDLFFDHEAGVWENYPA